ncbi:MAG: sorbitol-6-phosphate dehydrogenase [Abditibacteriota bacterium]|nr:sorbitol-6-phosphate dehydrogenase [Abditibacteriota bacterium]MBP5094118.1 sorbitol-6-phosphate dehydrogenase [Abditibacteriota bacterium]MBP5738609.1 sorbitol-6-phosphate dehydrogenase [Abditibacteriota bacterium]
MKFENKTVLVTGGAQGLGEAISNAFAEEGANVIIADINGDGAKATAAKVAETYGVKAEGIAMNVTDDAGVGAAMDEIVKKYGKLDILVSNAGILKSGEITDFDVNVWRAVIEVNLIGYMVCAKHACRIMKEQKSGCIVQVNSKSGKKGSFKNSAYAASKFGGIGLTQSLALEMAEYGVRVNSVCPGNLLDGTLWKGSLFEQYAKNQGKTVEEIREKYINQVPMKRPCLYKDVTDVIKFLASDEASYMTGQAINVTGGQEMR